MKKIILTIILMASIMCLFAQNHQHFVPYRSESIRIIKMDTSIYKETTTVVVEGLSTTTEVEVKALYSIPKHLRKLDTDIIDSIVRKNKPFTTIKWSWFVIWEYTYTKTQVTKAISWLAIKNLFIGYVSLLLFFFVVASFHEKSIKKGFSIFIQIPFVYEDKKLEIALLLAYHVIIDVIAILITVLHDDTIDLDVFLGFVVYNGVILLLFYFMYVIYRLIGKKI